MSEVKVAYNSETRVATIIRPDTPPPEGSAILGSLNASALGASSPQDLSHQHVFALLERNGVADPTTVTVKRGLDRDSMRADDLSLTDAERAEAQLVEEEQEEGRQAAPTGVVKPEQDSSLPGGGDGEQVLREEGQPVDESTQPSSEAARADEHRREVDDKIDQLNNEQPADQNAGPAGDQTQNPATSGGENATNQEAGEADAGQGNQEAQEGPQQVSLKIGEQIDLVDGTTKGLTFDVKDESDGVVKLDRRNGKVTAVKVGTTTVTVTAKDGAADQVVITVHEAGSENSEQGAGPDAKEAGNEPS